MSFILYAEGWYDCFFSGSTGNGYITLTPEDLDRLREALGAALHGDEGHKWQASSPPYNDPPFRCEKHEIRSSVDLLLLADRVSYARRLGCGCTAPGPPIGLATLHSRSLK